jgi:SAM-dependent methyltransferase
MISDHEIFQAILQRAAITLEKDGSLAFDSLISIYQYQILYDTVKQWIPQGATTLDWGTGCGHFAYYLQKNGYQVSAYGFQTPTLIQPEIENEHIQYKPAAPNSPVALPYKNQSFEAICSIGVLEHVTEVGGSETASLSEIARCLQPSGIFLCYHFPNRGSWIEWMARKVGHYHHINTYTRHQIEQLFKAEFDILVIRRYAIFPRNMLRKLPQWITSNRAAIRWFNTLDQVFAKLIPWFCQNWLIVAKRKPLLH